MTLATVRLQEMVTVMCAAAAVTSAFISLSSADGFEPQCDESHLGNLTRDCWNPVEVEGHQACHFHGAVTPYHHAPPFSWSGACRAGKADGVGILEDDLGNRSEGRLVAGVKDGAWTTRHADGGVIEEAHADGKAHGRWTFDFSAHKGPSYVVNYGEGVAHGRWERRDTDDYNVTGTFEEGARVGTWAFTWPNGVEALVPYVDGEMAGEMTVIWRGEFLGTLVYWKGRHVDGVLDPYLFSEPLDP